MSASPPMWWPGGRDWCSRVRALEGVKCVLPGTAVEEGQLLISGVEDTDTFGARLLAGMGTVQARTWYTLSAMMPLTAQEKSYTGEEKLCVSLVIGKERVKFFSNSSIEGRKYDKITTRHPFSLFGLPLPVTVVTERYRFYETGAVGGDPGRPRGRPGRFSRRISTPWWTPTAGALRVCSSRSADGGVLVTLRAECEEQIGETVPIYQDNPDGSRPAKR